MYGENGVTVDLEEAARVIAACEVFAIGFAHFPERLLVDTRSDQEERPLIQVVEPTRSAPEQSSWLYRRRPSLGPPLSLTLLGWPHSPSFLVESGVWECIRSRINGANDADVQAQCNLALRQIQNLHISATQALLRGDQCIDLWPRPEVPKASV